MDSVLLQSPIEDHSPDLAFSKPTTYEPMLRESIKRFTAGIRREGFDFAGFRSVISRQIHSSADPPLAIVWLYSAASYHESIVTNNSLDRLRAVRNLLHLLSAFSAAAGAAKSIALIAPVVYELYQCAAQGKEMKEVECLAEGVLSYISICSGSFRDLEEGSMGLDACFLDLVNVWTMRRCDGEGSLEAFFPLVSGEVRRRFEMEGCGIGCLAGVVIAEAFLLRLCLKVKGGGASRHELQKELGIWAVSSITAFCNRRFFEILLKFLLDPKVNATALLNTEDEKLARGVLYDAVILVDYSFLFSGKETDQYNFIKNLLVTKLIVTLEAVKIGRTTGDHTKVISYLNAFSTSSLPSELINLIRKQIGCPSSEKPINSSPEALLKWLIHFEQEGRRVLDDEASRYATQLISEERNLLTVDSAPGDDEKMDDDLFFIDKGERNDVEMESMDVVFSSAARSMKESSINGRVKRKESSGEAGNRIKLVKYDIQNNLFGDSEIPVIVDGANSDSELENPLSDADMEESD